uniref:Transport and golgi organization 6 homolog n=2 Tax=Gasterosteus aculeatus aculeatus TaxID=481459 RepID=A0AAQ4RI04_GASAC|nr:transport and Golgi organization protein 6 homolog [Gasterosteus aculeatus aculeatus]
MFPSTTVHSWHDRALSTSSRGRMAPIVPAILSAIKTLTNPLGEVSAHDAQSSHQDALVAVLRTNRALLQEQLQKESSLEEVRRLREEVMVAADWFGGDTEDATWAFVQECLLLLLTLSRQLSAELKLFQQTDSLSAARLRTAEMAPPLPPDVFSVAQQQTLSASLQFVVCLGLCPYLATGVGVSLGRRSAFGVMVDKLVRGGTVPAAGCRLFTTTKVLMQLTELSCLATLVFTRHLGDVLAALIQLGYQPRHAERSCSKEGTMHELRAVESHTCKEVLRSLLGKVYQPMIVKELLILQGGPKQDKSGAGGSSSNGTASGLAPTWLKRVCGRLLSERLMQSNGVQAVVRAILEGGTEANADWRKCDCVARILVICPQQSASADSYYGQVCRQILELLHFKDQLTAQQHQRVATRAVLLMVQEKPNFAHQYLLTPLLEPLHRCSTASDEVDSHAAVEECELTRCVTDVYKICVVGNSPSASLLGALEEVLPVIFTLFCFTKQNVSHLRAPCEEILLWYLSHADTSAARSALRQLSGLQDPKNEVAAKFHFTPGSDGGARLSSREISSEEDDALYEKLSEEQWRLECLMQLLADLKHCDLPGDFFLDLLQEMASWEAAADGEREDDPELDITTMTLVEVEQRLLAPSANQSRKLALLQVLAVMVDCVQHTVLLRKTSQVVDFLMSLLQRACLGLGQASGPVLGRPVESETLRLGIGVVATLLSGPKLSQEDYSSMWRLLPPLESLSQKHPEVLIQQLASDLRAVIATHGAYRPENFPAVASASMKPKMTVKNTQTGANNPQISPHSSPPDRNAKSNRPPASFGKSAAKVSPEGRTSGTSTLHPPTKPFSDWLLEACDPDVPTRAFALRVLTQMVKSGNPEAAHNQEKLLMLFLENLEHEDSFIYLSAIQGLSALADSNPERVLERLLKDFHHGPSRTTSNKEHSLEFRLKVGEVLMRASRAMGELATHLGHPLISVFLQGTRDPDQSVRASSLSNLGELCPRLDYTLGTLAQELCSCLTALIKTEKEAEVRRAAVHVITLLLRGLSDKTTEVLSDVLLDLYRALKWVVRSDPDDVAVLHAQLALEEMDDIMKRFIFPKQKLQKKIVVLP